MKIFRRIENKIVAINTNAKKKMEENTESVRIDHLSPVTVEEGVDPVFGKPEFYTESEEGKTKEEIEKIRSKIKSFFKY